ncbi:hypothetical protein MXB_3144 [Myxobolus squamalis]|nr:hypothetical protein MXB_3144 [Myxobolus squamalis]
MILLTQVAVKIISRPQIIKIGLEKVKREIACMKILNHPNIARLLEYAESDNEIIIITEYISGGELYHYLVSRGRIKENIAREKYRQIISAVHYCHSLGVVHRDLKAENIMIDFFNNLKIIDFGFSNKFDGKNTLDTFCGSPMYAAPELFRGEGYLGPEVDVWALGVLLFLMLTGSLPFKVDSFNVFLLPFNEGYKIFSYQRIY